MRIGNRVIDSKHKPLIIAEIGVNHQGSIRRAKQMVRLTKIAGAECVKFQHFNVDDMLVKLDKKTYNMLKGLQLTLAEQIELKKYAKKFDLIYLCTPFSYKCAKELNDINIAAFKIGSGQSNNLNFIRYISSFNKPMIVSTGMSNLKQVEKISEVLKKSKVDFALLHCVSQYPTPLNKVNLNRINKLKEYSDVVGFSDHSQSISPALGAIALGANIIEKHFSWSLDILSPDISSSINRKKLKELILEGNEIWKAR